MAKYQKRSKKKKFPLALIIVIILIAYSVYTNGFEETFGLDPETIQTFLTNNDDDKYKKSTVVTGDETLEVQFLDVGQADAIFIQNKENNMLIDAGNNNDGKLLVEYFQGIGVTHFKYLVGTHPHEDHIGGLDDIIDSFDVDKLYLPDVITTTVTFTDVLDSLDKKNMRLNIPRIGDVWDLGDAKIEVLYTGTNQKDLNSTSIVLKLTYGDVKFLFTGDATPAVEKELIKKNLKANVLKVAHHGSPYSTTDSFFQACNPDYAVISVGKGNSYGHPGDNIIQKFKKYNVEIHRTDEEGTVIAISDGKSVRFSSKKTNVDGG